MTEHLSEQSIERYQRRDLAAAELLTVDDHLATCDECYQRVRTGYEHSQVVLDYLTGAGPAGLSSHDDHLTYEQLTAFLDNELDEIDHEIATVHLEVCQQCTEELYALQELKEPSPVHAAELRRRTPLERLNQIVSLWLQPARAWPRVAAATLIVVVASASVWMVFRAMRQPPPEAAQSNRPAPTESPASLTARPPLQSSPTPISTPRVLVVLNDAGSQVTLDDAGNIIGLGALSPSSSASVRKALTTQRLSIAPALEGLRGKNRTLMGTAGDGVPFALLNPVGTVVRSNRPTFQWRPLQGATAYVVKVYDLNFNEVATSPAQPGTNWTAGAALPRGVVYLWQVTAIKNGDEIKSAVPPAPEARFRVLARDKVVEIENVEKAQANSHLALGATYAEAGLLDDAEKQFRQLLRANPRSPVARKLLQQVSK